VLRGSSSLKLSPAGFQPVKSMGPPPELFCRPPNCHKRGLTRQSGWSARHEASEYPSATGQKYQSESSAQLRMSMAAKSAFR
jgi:hypothetical protein